MAVLSVIIVNYNVKYFLEQCLFSVKLALAGIEGEVIVVDNASQDGSREYLEGKFPWARFIWNPGNTGFAHANNQALALAGGKYILFLNPDTLVPEDGLRTCIRFFEAHPEAGALGVTMVDGSGRFLKESKRGYPSLLTSFFKLAGLSSLFPTSALFGRYHLGHLDAGSNHEVDVLAGAFLMAKKEVLDKTGGFDDKFFMYGEDIDLSYRIQQLGYKNYYCAETTIIHFKGESTRKGSLNYVRLFYQAMMIFVRKHYHGVSASLFRVFIGIGIGVRAVISAVAAFIRKTGMPIIDAILILLSFIAAKNYWNHFVKPDTIYDKGLLTIAFPVFTVIFVLISYYTGLYDRQQEKGRVIRSTMISMIFLLAIYSLLPERFRFSRGIILTGSLFAFILLSIDRWLLRKWNIVETEEEEKLRTIIAGTPAEYQRAMGLMHVADKEERVLGRVAVSDDGKPCLTTIDHLPLFYGDIPVREIIYCQGQLSFSEIIAHVKRLPSGIRMRITAAESGSIVGSDSSNSSGEIVSRENHYRISKPFYARLKRLLDMITSVVMILGFPVHLFGVKRPLHMLRNAFIVLFGGKTWVGYSSRGKNGQLSVPDGYLPPLRDGVLGSNAIPVHTVSEGAEGLLRIDQQYARDYSPYRDIYLITRGYRWLGT